MDDRDVAKAWLKAVTEFAVQPWHELAGVYDRHGRPSDAKWLRFQAARATTRHSPWYVKAVRILYGLFAGYGYYPLLAAGWLALAAFLAGVLTLTFATSNASGFDPGLYAAAIVIPPAAAIVPSAWTITAPLCVSWALIALRAFGWLMTAILLAGLTGLLKKN